MHMPSNKPITFLFKKLPYQVTYVESFFTVLVIVAKYWK